MRVVQLQCVGRANPLYYAEIGAVGVSSVSVGIARGRSRLDRIARSARAAVLRGGRRTGRVGRRVLTWLGRPISVDESLLRGLRTAEAVDLYHPARIHRDDALLAWTRYLGRRGLEEWLAAIGQLLLAVLSLPLMVLPGPNVVGFWFLWRSSLHGLAALGSRRARRSVGSTTCIPVSQLDEPLDINDPPQIQSVASACGLVRLSGYLKRLDREAADLSSRR